MMPFSMLHSILVLKSIWVVTMGRFLISMSAHLLFKIKFDVLLQFFFPHLKNYWMDCH